MQLYINSLLNSILVKLLFIFFSLVVATVTLKVYFVVDVELCFQFCVAIVNCSHFRCPQAFTKEKIYVHKNPVLCIYTDIN